VLESETLLVVFQIGFGLSLLVGAIWLAKRRGTSWLNVLILSLILSPIVGIIAAAVLPKRDNPEEPEQPGMIQSFFIALAIIYFAAIVYSINYAV
jgi:thiol:disulfide interchange protein